jgi:hypothetical protein
MSSAAQKWPLPTPDRPDVNQICSTPPRSGNAANRPIVCAYRHLRAGLEAKSWFGSIGMQTRVANCEPLDSGRRTVAVWRILYCSSALSTVARQSSLHWGKPNTTSVDERACLGQANDQPSNATSRCSLSNDSIVSGFLRPNPHSVATPKSVSTSFADVSRFRAPAIPSVR